MAVEDFLTLKRAPEVYYDVPAAQARPTLSSLCGH